MGHNAIVHGAIIGDNCLIGMGATILDNAVVPSGCIIAANALVLRTPDSNPTRSMPACRAKRSREVTPEAARRDHPPHGPRLHALRLVA